MTKKYPTPGTEEFAPRAGDHFIDITAETCPMTFVRTKLMIERIRPGETLEVRLKGKEPLENVPRSLADHGHRVIELVPETPGESGPGAVHRLLARKGG